MNYLNYLSYLKYIGELKLHQKMSRKDLEEIQEKKLRKMINHAYNNVPFYRTLFDKNNIDPSDIKKIDDLQKLPIITKKEIQANYDNILANGTEINQCRIVNTTGSTGIPLSIYNDKKSLLYSSALVYFAFFEAGIKFTDSIVELTGIMEDPTKTLIKRNLISTHETPEKIIEELKKYNADILYSFPSIFKILSPSDELSSLNTRLIFTHGETLTESARKTISSAFGAKVCNTYGATEFNRLGFECSEYSGLHLLSDCAIIELVKDGQNVNVGEEGETVVTGLYNYTMPLIRYNLGDICTMADYQCPCGRSWPMIKTIEGRSDDFLTLPSGKIISPRNINVIENVPGIIQYRTTQIEKDSFLVEVIPGKEFSEESKRQIYEQIGSGCFGEAVNIDIKLVEDIPRERTGKLRTVVSKI